MYFFLFIILSPLSILSFGIRIFPLTSYENFDPVDNDLASGKKHFLYGIFRELTFNLMVKIIMICYSSHFRYIASRIYNSLHLFIKLNWKRCNFYDFLRSRNLESKFLCCLAVCSVRIPRICTYIRGLGYNIDFSSERLRVRYID